MHQFWTRDVTAVLTVGFQNLTLVIRGIRVKRYHNSIHFFLEPSCSHYVEEEKSRVTPISHVPLDSKKGSKLLFPFLNWSYLFRWCNLRSISYILVVWKVWATFRTQFCTPNWSNMHAKIGVFTLKRRAPKSGSKSPRSSKISTGAAAVWETEWETSGAMYERRSGGVVCTIVRRRDGEVRVIKTSHNGKYVVRSIIHY